MIDSYIKKLLVFMLFGLCSFAINAQNDTNIWWQPSESGWGLFLVDQESMQFPAWYTYGKDGKATWFIGAASPKQGGVYQGDVFAYTGVPFDQISGQASDPAKRVGEVQFTRSGDRLNFSYTVDGQTQTKQLEPFPFGDQKVQCDFAAEPSAEDMTDLWYDPASSGWGVNMVQSSDTNITMAWYTYGADRQPIWILGFLNKDASGAFVGDLYQGTSGTPFMQIDNKPATEGTKKVGTVALRLNEVNKATMEYTIGAVTQSKSMERIRLGKAQRCKTVPLSGSTNPVSGTNSCFPAVTVGDEWHINTQTVTTSPVSNTTSGTRMDKVVARTTFEGKEAYALEERNADGTVGSTVYFDQTDSEYIMYGALSIDGQGNEVKSVFSPPRRTPLNMNVGDVLNLNYKILMSGAQINQTLTYEEKLTFEAKEDVTVPAGTFKNACKFRQENKIQYAGTVAGQSVAGGLGTKNITSWSHGSVGRVKFAFELDEPVAAPGANIRIKLNTEDELTKAKVGGQSYP